MDGMRCIAFVDGANVKLLSRRGQNITAQYPALTAALPALCKCRMVLDGEIIALNEQGKPSFQLLQKRMNLLKVTDINRADARIPVHFFVFDAVHVGDYNIARCTLLERKKLLRDNLQKGSSVLLLNHFEEDGEIAFKACIENGFEGIVAKRRDSVYEVGRRSPYWVKVKAQKSAEFVIGGFSLGQGGRSSSFGSLLLGYYDESTALNYVGSVGTGFDERLLQDMMRRMNPLKSSVCPFKQKPGDKKDAQWLKPELVAEIKFMDFTADMHLRNPVFLHLRPDISAADVHLVQAIFPSQFDLDNGAKGKRSSLPAVAESASTHWADDSTKLANAESFKKGIAAQDPTYDVEARTETETAATIYMASPPAGATGESYDSESELSDSYADVGDSRYDVDDSRADVDDPCADVGDSRADVDNPCAYVDDSRTDVDDPCDESPADLELKHWHAEAKSLMAQLSGREKNLIVMIDRYNISLTNMDKILFPARKAAASINKRDFLKMIAFLSPYILYHIQNRPLTMIRAPRGLRSRSFYQKHWNLDIPDFFETIRTEPQDPARKDQLLCNNVAALLFLAQNNILEYHCWLSRLAPGEQLLHHGGTAAEMMALDKPDYLAFDIDFHKEGESEKDELDQEAFAKTREAAQLLRELLQSLRLNPFLKTSGRNGLHVFIPILPDLRFDELRVLAETIAKHLVSQHFKLIALNPVEARRSNKVFLDYYENTRGRTLAAPYTPRLTPSATISTPLSWEELNNIYPGDFNIFTITNRLEKKHDIWKCILDNREDLAQRFTNRAKS